MSWAVPACPRCEGSCRCEGAGPFPPGTDASYGVIWRCDPCDYRSVDICPAPPPIPRRGCCLNCGSALDGALCQGCGLDGAWVEALIDAACPDHTALFEESARCAQRGLVRLALHLIDTRLIEQPDDTTAWTRKAALLSSVGLRRRAVSLLEAALDAGVPRRLLVSLGCELSDAGRYAEAASVFERMREGETDPLWLATALTNQGNALVQLGEGLRADALYLQAIALQPDNIAIYLNRAGAQRQRSAHDSARQTLTEALARATPAERPRVLHRRAEALCELERAEEALIDIDEAVLDGVDLAAKSYVRGWALGMLGRLEEALESMEATLRLDPGHPAATRGRDMIRSALGIP